MSRKPGAISEGHRFIEVSCDRMTEICLHAGVVSDQFEAGFSIDHEHHFAAERHERKRRVRAEAALVGDTNTRQWGVCEAGSNLGLCRIKLRPGPLNLAAERAEFVGVYARGQPDNQSQLVSQNRPNHSLLCVHRGKNSDGVFVRTIISRHGQNNPRISSVRTIRHPPRRLSYPDARRTTPARFHRRRQQVRSLRTQSRL